MYLIYFKLLTFFLNIYIIYIFIFIFFFLLLTLIIVIINFTFNFKKYFFIKAIVKRAFIKLINNVIYFII